MICEVWLHLSAISWGKISTHIFLSLKYFALTVERRTFYSGVLMYGIEYDSVSKVYEQRLGLGLVDRNKYEL
jgi:hypothetical protein